MQPFLFVAETTIWSLDSGSSNAPAPVKRVSGPMAFLRLWREGRTVTRDEKKLRGDLEKINGEIEEKGLSIDTSQRRFKLKSRLEAEINYKKNKEELRSKIDEMLAETDRRISRDSIYFMCRMLQVGYGSFLEKRAEYARAPITHVETNETPTEKGLMTIRGGKYVPKPSKAKVGILSDEFLAWKKEHEESPAPND